MSKKIAVNLLTLSRIILSALFATLLLTPDIHKALPIALYAFACATDILDGRLARRWGVTTRLGAKLDVIADLTLLLAAFTAMAVKGMMPWWMLAVAVLKFSEFWATSRVLIKVQGGAGALFFDKLGRLSAILMLALPLLSLLLYTLLPYPAAWIIAVCCAQGLTLMAAVSSVYRVKRCVDGVTHSRRAQCCIPAANPVSDKT